MSGIACLFTSWMPKRHVGSVSLPLPNTLIHKHTLTKVSIRVKVIVLTGHTSFIPSLVGHDNIKKITTKGKKSAECMFSLCSSQCDSTSHTQRMGETGTPIQPVGCCLAAATVFSHTHSPHHTHTLVCMIASFVLDSCMHASTYLNKAIWRLCNRFFSLCTTYIADREVTQSDLTQSICACKAWFI